MQLSELKQYIVSERIYTDLIIFVCPKTKLDLKDKAEEADNSNKVYIAKQYINSLAELKQADIRYINSLSDLNKLADPTLAYLFNDDTNYLNVLNVEKLEELSAPEELLDTIIICEKLDKTIKDIASPYVIEIEEPVEWQVEALINNLFPWVEQDDFELLYRHASGKVFKICNELNKLELIESADRAKELRASLVSKYSYLYYLSQLSLSKLLIDCRDKYNKQLIREFLTHRSCTDIDGMAVVKLLLNSFIPALLLVEGSGVTIEAIVPEIKGQNTKGKRWAITNSAKLINKNFSRSEIIEIVDFLSSLDYKLKSNLLDMTKEELVDYIICHIVK